MPEPQAKKLKATPAAQDLSGIRVGRFAIRVRLGAGGMGEVYLADDLRLKRPVALKRLSPKLRDDAQYHQRLLREAEFASRLSSQHIAAIYDLFESEEESFLVMEYVEGQSLRQHIGQRFSQTPGNPFPVRTFLDIAVQCASALAAAHEKGVVHRDIKPENIMLTPKNQVKVLDFGVAHPVVSADSLTSDDPLNRNEVSGGTIAYMAPEVLLEKETDARADIFSLGLVFYEALTGKNPFLASTALATSNRILHEDPPSISRANAEVPLELERIVAKMLEKDPVKRYACAEDLLAELRLLAGAETPPAAPALPLPRRRIWPRVGTAAAALAVALVVLAAIPAVRQRVGRWFGVIAPPAEKNVAVLPFVAVGGDAQSKALCDGLVDTLTAKLSQLTERGNLQVVPNREVRARGLFSAEQARRELGVNLALTGSWHQSGDTVRVNYALVDAQTGRQLRAGTITSPASDPFAVEDRVVREVLDALELELNPAENQSFSAHGTHLPRAYDFYLRGRGYLQEYDKRENIDSAIGAFQQSLAIDPGYAPAYTGRGEAYWRKYEDTKERKWVDEAQTSCKRALELDPHLAAGHICLGTLYNGTGKPDAAVSEFEWALGIEPTSDDAYRGLAFAFESLGRPDEAERTFRRAIALRPHYWAGYSWLGSFLAHEARYPEAIEQFKQAIVLAPDNATAYRSLGGIYVLKGDYAEATAALQKAINLRPTFEAFTNLGYVYFSQRKFTEAVPLFEEAFRLHPKEYRACGNLARAYLWAPGTRNKAHAMYRQAIDLAREQLRVNPRDADVHVLLASFSAATGARKDALAHIHTALSLLPDDPEFLFYAAIIYNQTGKEAEALDSLDKALARGYSPAQIEATVELDSLRGNPRFQALLQRKK